MVIRYTSCGTHASWPAFAPRTWPLLALLAACSEGGTPAGDAPARDVQAAAAEEDGTVLHLEARFVEGDAFGEVTYKVVREDGALVRELQVEVEGATPGRSHPVTVDGQTLGELRTDLDGEGELEVRGSDPGGLPGGVPEPAAGSVVRLGELAEVRLSALEKLLRLATPVDGGGLVGEVQFQRERLGDDVLREFVIEIDAGPPEVELEVRVGGVLVGTIVLDDDGEGEIEWREGSLPTLPDAFPEVAAGTRVEVGDLWSGTLR